MTAPTRSAVLVLCVGALLVMTAVTARHAAGGGPSRVVVADGARPFPPIELNSARWEDLVLLPGIGESRARRIVAFRERSGGFRSVGELDRVPGVGPAMIDRFRESVFVRHPGAETAR